jgi:hypothetical protein
MFNASFYPFLLGNNMQDKDRERYIYINTEGIIFLSKVYTCDNALMGILLPLMGLPWEISSLV